MFMTITVYHYCGGASAVRCPRNFPTLRADAPNACLTWPYVLSSAFPVASPAVEIAESVFWLLDTRASIVESPAAMVDCAGRFAGLTHAISEAEMLSSLATATG